MARKKRLSDRVIAYQAFFNTKDGQAVLEDLNDRFWGNQSEFSEDAREHARRSGERNVVLFIRSMLNVSKKDIEDLLKEERDE